MEEQAFFVGVRNELLDVFHIPHACSLDITNAIMTSCFRIPDGSSPEERMIRVLEFYLTSFHIGRKVSYWKITGNDFLT